MEPREYIPFRGKLQKMRLVANNMGYGPLPPPDEEVEQRLTVTANGKVWLSRWCETAGMATDVAIWELKLTNTEGKSFRYAGPMLRTVTSELDQISDKLRLLLHQDDLFAFDGNP